MTNGISGKLASQSKKTKYFLIKSDLQYSKIMGPAPFLKWILSPKESKWVKP